MIRRLKIIALLLPILICYGLIDRTSARESIASITTTESAELLTEISLYKGWQKANSLTFAIALSSARG